MCKPTMVIGNEGCNACATCSACALCATPPLAVMGAGGLICIFGQCSNTPISIIGNSR